jgi:P27 family predicted phage terminase small subunit
MRPKAPDKRVGHPRGSALAPVAGAIPLSQVKPEPPGHLSEVGLEVWDLVWDYGAKVYQPADAILITRYAELQDRRAQMLRTLEQDGYFTVGSQGQLAQHPAARILSDVEAKLVPLEDRLGLSPESRARLGIVTVEAESKLDSFLKRHA